MNDDMKLNDLFSSLVINVIGGILGGLVVVVYTGQTISINETSMVTGIGLLFISFVFILVLYLVLDHLRCRKNEKRSKRVGSSKRI